MAPSLTATCLASLILADKPTPTLGFLVRSSAGRVRPRPCFRSGPADERPPPRVDPPRRPQSYSSLPESAESSGELALLKLNRRMARANPARSSWRGAGAAEQAVFHIHDMRMRGLKNDRSVYSAAVLACARSGDTGRALFLLKDASKRGVTLLPEDVAGIMRAVSRQGIGWRQALALYQGFLELAVEQAQAKTSTKGGVDATLSSLDTTNDSNDNNDRDVGDDVPTPLVGLGQQLHLLSEVTPGWQDVCQAALEACTRGGQWERALEVLSILRAGGGGAELSQENYNQAIEVCGNGRAWDMVLLLVAEMSSDEIPICGAASETALKGCAATGAWSWALSLLRRMSVSPASANGGTLNVSHYLDALRSCGKVVDKPGGQHAKSAAKAALELVQDLRETGWLIGQEGEDSYTYALQACARAQDAWSALALLESALDEGLSCGVALRTMAMQACSGAGEWRAALSILDDMQAAGLRPDGASYVAAMEACARGGVMDRALSILERVLMLHPGDEKTISAGYHGAIKACENGGQWAEATSLLQRMRQDPVAVVTSNEYNAAILACCRAQQSVAALTLLGDMSVESKHCRANETSYVLVMRAFGREGRWRTVIDLMGSLQEEAGLVPTVACYNVVVEALAKAGEWMKALGMLAEMKQIGVRPTEFTYSRCMAACERSGKWEHTLALLEDMKKQEDLVPDNYIFSTAMMACSKAGRLDDVLGILQEMREMSSNSGPNLVNYNIAIGSCARAGDWQRMLDEMDKMRREDIAPEESTFSGPLDACGRVGNLPMAFELLDRMRECGVDPGVVTYGYAVAAACRAGEHTSAARLLDEMEAAGHPPNERTYGVAALACREGTNADTAVHLLHRRKAKGLPPDALVLSFAVQACSNAGDMERGLELITEMKNAGFIPDAAFYTGVIAGINCAFTANTGRS
ncbi:unnamed protein product [Scytosiphon promiscuus]